MVRVAVVAFALLASCSYVLPRTWRAFQTAPSQAEIAIRRSLSAMNMEISEAQPESIVGGWRYGREGLLRTRERFIVQWANQEGEGLVVYVRHEWQEQSGEMGAAAKFGTVEHSQSRETALLDRIQTELSGLTR